MVLQREDVRPARKTDCEGSDRSYVQSHARATTEEITKSSASSRAKNGKLCYAYNFPIEYHWYLYIDGARIRSADKPLKKNFITRTRID